jgi:ATP-dependent exoDNAse (exonuclease V) beta subunit
MANFLSSGLRQQLKAEEQTRASLESEVNAAKLKNGKLLVKVKTLTKELETLKRKKSADGFDDLDRALEEEMNNQVAKVYVACCRREYFSYSRKILS